VFSFYIVKENYSLLWMYLYAWKKILKGNEEKVLTKLWID